MPTPDVLEQNQANLIADLIEKTQRTAEKTLYRGVSTSRIDNSILGSAEYSKNNWIWPDGFGEHYVRKYRVKPSDEFLKFIGYI